MKRSFQTAIITETVVADVTTQTASDTIRKDMGLGENLVALRRWDLWLFRVESPLLDQALQVTNTLATGTKLFVNPNKHRFQVKQLTLNVIPPNPTPVDGGHQFHFTTRFREDTRGQVALENLRKLYLLGEDIESIDFGTLWSITLQAPDADQASQLFNRLLIAQDANSGLFLNPHSQVVLFVSSEV